MFGREKGKFWFFETWRLKKAIVNIETDLYRCYPNECVTIGKIFNRHLEEY